jgi:hypothetical protein
MYDFTLTQAGVAIVVIIGIIRLLRIGKRDSRMPPGPPTLPLLGNLHQVPITGLYKQYVVTQSMLTAASQLIMNDIDSKRGVKSTEEFIR